jgi:hypothetical protein
VLGGAQVSFGTDLTDFDVVRSSAASISRRLKGVGGRRMPPPPDAPLTPAQIELFDSHLAAHEARSVV